MVFGANRLADFRDRGFGDRGLIAERFGKGGLDIPDGQAAHERRDHHRLQGVGFRHVLAEQPRRERCGGAAQLRPLQRDPPGGGLTVTGRYPLREPSLTSGQAALRW